MKQTVKSWLKCLLKAVIAGTILLVLGGGLAYLFRYPLLTGVGGFLVVNDPLPPADIIFVLNGDPETRPFQAVELFNRELAPQIVIAQAEDTPSVELGLTPNTTDVAVGVMQKLGVPPDKITILPQPAGATSTQNEAELLRRYIETHPVDGVIVVTSAFHTRRAHWILDKYLADLPVEMRMAPAPHPDFDQTNWWRQENGLLTCLNEYIKLCYYWVMYR